MKFQFSVLRHKGHLFLEEEESYTKDEIKEIYSLIDVEKVHVDAELQNEGDIAHIHFAIKGNLILECAYTLEPVDYPIDFEEDLEFSNQSEYEDDENVIFVGSDLVDLHPYILGLIITEIPMKVVKKGAKLPSGGKGYEVISEEDYYKTKEETTDPRLSKLDDFDLSDEE